MDLRSQWEQVCEGPVASCWACPWVVLLLSMPTSNYTPSHRKEATNRADLMRMLSGTSGSPGLGSSPRIQASSKTPTAPNQLVLHAGWGAGVRISSWLVGPGLVQHPAIAPNQLVLHTGRQWGACQQLHFISRPAQTSHHASGPAHSWLPTLHRDGRW